MIILIILKEIVNFVPVWFDRLGIILMKQRFKIFAFEMILRKLVFRWIFLREYISRKIFIIMWDLVETYMHVKIIEQHL